MALLAGSWLLLVFLEGRNLFRLVLPFASHTSIIVTLFESCLSQSNLLSLYSWSFQVLVLLFHPVHRLLEGKSLTPIMSQICSAASENENTILGAFNS